MSTIIELYCTCGERVRRLVEDEAERDHYTRGWLQEHKGSNCRQTDEQGFKESRKNKFKRVKTGRSRSRF
jgi:hypothetical protein